MIIEVVAVSTIPVLTKKIINHCVHLNIRLMKAVC